MWLFLANSLSAQLEYRANFVGSVLASFGEVAVGLLGLVLFFGASDRLGGWTFPQAALVLGFFMLAESFISVLLQPNLNRIAEQVRLGTMDFNLLKPVDAQFLVSTRQVNVFRLSDAVVGLLVIGWAAPRLPDLTWGGALLAALLFASALVMVYSVWFMLSTTAFWFVKVQNVTELFNGVFSAGRFPAAAFPAWVRTALTFVVPVAFVTTVPAEAALGRLDAGLALWSPVVALALLAASRLFWTFALRSYTSASS